MGNRPAVPPCPPFPQTTRGTSIGVSPPHPRNHVDAPIGQTCDISFTQITFRCFSATQSALFKRFGISLRPFYCPTPNDSGCHGYPRWNTMEEIHFNGGEGECGGVSLSYCSKDKFISQLVEFRCWCISIKRGNSLLLCCPPVAAKWWIGMVSWKFSGIFLPPSTGSVRCDWGESEE